MNPWN